jgi:hypothetical protein
MLGFQRFVKIVDCLDESIEDTAQFSQPCSFRTKAVTLQDRHARRLDLGEALEVAFKTLARWNSRGELWNRIKLKLAGHTILPVRWAYGKMMLANVSADTTPRYLRRTMASSSGTAVMLFTQ